MGGHIHRDISMFNVLVFKNYKGWEWLVKLNDFEYVRKLGEFRNDETVLTVSTL